MSDSSVIVTKTDDGVARLTLNEPDRRNPLSVTLVATLQRELTALANDDDVRAIVIHGEGRGFCSGADLSRMQESSLLEDRTEFESILDLNKTIWGYPKPTVAAVHGFALAGGCSLMSWCDFAVVEEGTRIGFPEVMGGVPAASVIPTLLRVVGRRATLELALTGTEVDLHRAVELGLISHVVEQGEALTASMELAGKMASFNPIATQFTKEIIRTVGDMTYEQGLSYAREMRVLARTAPGFAPKFGTAEKKG